MVSGPDRQDPDPVPSPADPGDPREWCAAAVAWLDRDQPEAALEAARHAVDRDPTAEAGADWGYRLASLAFERLGRAAEAVAAAEEAVRLAPGSWAARLRLGAALRRVPGRWRESSAQAARAARYAPGEPDPHVLVGDLALLRGEHRRAESAYRTALRLAADHPGARINLGLAFLRWERPRGHHDPAWPIDPRETGRARHALEMWSRQVRVLLAAVLVAVMVVAFGFGLTPEARIGGAAALLAVLAVTFGQGRRVRLWRYVLGMLVRDPWLGASVSATLAAVVAYTAAIVTLPPLVLPPPSLDSLLEAPWPPDPPGGVWAGLAAVVLLNGAATLALRVPVEAWRGRPVRALAEFTAVHRDRTARRNVNATLWLLVGRAWSALAVVALAAGLLGAQGPALLALAVPPALVWTRARGGLARCLDQVLAADRWLVVARTLLVAASLALAFAGAAAVAPLVLPAALGEWAWWTGITTLAALVGVFAVRSARAWWRGAPGPWRSALAMCESRGHRLPGDMRAPVGLSGEVRRAFTHAREVVLAYADPGGPRALAVGAVSSVSASGELRLIAADDAWEAAERDPRVAVFVADPLERRFWVEVRGVAVGDAEADVLRITPEQVVVAEYPGRHQGRDQGRDRARRLRGGATRAE
ncbi:hypothetical protein GCM10017600_54730 [Streptosporangium carneum]|uniref:Tetratricopeptide repeat protein n=1 Tax=Streptosporangium carneum TaxID=47481 RepID=A0A9W6I6X2_9ACTN|nr:hypothetical protein GCM10017600_54730 [Streptosporangium carneum]